MKVLSCAAMALALSSSACNAPTSGQGLDAASASLDAGDGGVVLGDAFVMPEPCNEEGVRACSEDAQAVLACRAGTWTVERRCDGDGFLCEHGMCVAPWRVGSPTFDACIDNPRATPGTLAGKAVYFDALATRLHLHPALKWIAPVTLREGASVDSATYEDVAQWTTGSNDGLWSSLFLAAQAYRYAVTRSPEALQTIRVLVEGEADRMDVTGVPGLFARQFVPPRVPGIACPDDLARYVPDPDKDDERFVRIRRAAASRWSMPRR